MKGEVNLSWSAVYKANPSAAVLTAVERGCLSFSCCQLSYLTSRHKVVGCSSSVSLHWSLSTNSHLLHCNLTTNFASLHWNFSTNNDLLHCNVTTNFASLHWNLSTNSHLLHCNLTTNFAMLHWNLSTNNGYNIQNYSLHLLAADIWKSSLADIRLHEELLCVALCYEYFLHGDVKRNIFQFFFP